MALIKDPTCYGNPMVHGNMNTVTIGKYCSVSDTAAFDGGCQHNTRFVTTYPLWLLGAPENKEGMCRGDICVGNDVWIGDGAFIMSGVTIGDGAVIGARSVVTHHVSSYAIVAGAPAQFKAFRFGESVRSKLLRLRWWDWPKEKILELSPYLLSNDIDTFLRMAGA